MINSKKMLKEYLLVERTLYLGDSKAAIKHRLLKTEDYRIWRFQKQLRKSEYHFNLKHRIRYFLSQKLKNYYGSNISASIYKNNADVGLRIWHYGVIINGYAKIGKNCQLHGNNCIGNKGDDRTKAPILGDNVDVGVGAKIIGDVYIADGVRIGANAVVVNSCTKRNAVLVGIPAKDIS